MGHALGPPGQEGLPEESTAQLTAQLRRASAVGNKTPQTRKSCSGPAGRACPLQETARPGGLTGEGDQDTQGAGTGLCPQRKPLKATHARTEGRCLTLKLAF